MYYVSEYLIKRLDDQKKNMLKSVMKIPLVAWLKWTATQGWMLVWHGMLMKASLNSMKYKIAQLHIGSR